MQLYDKVMENIIFLQFTDIMKIIRRQMITIDIWKKFISLIGLSGILRINV